MFQARRQDVGGNPFRRIGGKTYFMGDHPSSLDASAYGALVNTVGCPIESPTKEYALGKPNLVAYCRRMQQEFFSDLTAVA